MVELNPKIEKVKIQPRRSTYNEVLEIMMKINPRIAITVTKFK